MSTNELTTKNTKRHKEMHEAIPIRAEAAARATVDAALHVHKLLGPGLLESAVRALSRV